MVRSAMVGLVMIMCTQAAPAHAGWDGTQYVFTFSGSVPIAENLMMGGMVVAMIMPESEAGLILGYIGPTILLPRSFGTFSPMVQLKTIAGGRTSVGLSTITVLTPHRFVSIVAELDLLLATMNGEPEFYGIEKCILHPAKGMSLGVVAEETLDYTRFGALVGYGGESVSFELMSLTTPQGDTALRFMTSFQF